VSQHSLGFQIKIGKPKFYAGEMITPALELGLGLASLSRARRDNVISISSVIQKKMLKLWATFIQGATSIPDSRGYIPSPIKTIVMPWHTK
jgi:hypothetical protein